MEGLQKIGYVALTNPDGSLQLGVPVYIRVKELNAHGTTDQQEQLVKDAVTTMLEYYESQIAEYMAEMKKSKQGGVSDNGVSGNAADSNKCLSDGELHSLSDSRTETRSRA